MAYGGSPYGDEDYDDGQSARIEEREHREEAQRLGALTAEVAALRVENARLQRDLELTIRARDHAIAQLLATTPPAGPADTGE